jgi:hypothetical protein
MNIYRKVNCNYKTANGKLQITAINRKFMKISFSNIGGRLTPTPMGR